MFILPNGKNNLSGIKGISPKPVNKWWNWDSIPKLLTTPSVISCARANCPLAVQAPREASPKSMHIAQGCLGRNWAPQSTWLEGFTVEGSLSRKTREQPLPSETVGDFWGILSCKGFPLPTHSKRLHAPYRWALGTVKGKVKGRQGSPDVHHSGTLFVWLQCNGSWNYQDLDHLLPKPESSLPSLVTIWHATGPDAINPVGFFQPYRTGLQITMLFAHLYC